LNILFCSLEKLGLGENQLNLVFYLQEAQQKRVSIRILFAEATEW
jgi:hypothetical protein